MSSSEALSDRSTNEDSDSAEDDYEESTHDSEWLGIASPEGEETQDSDRTNVASRSGSPDVATAAGEKNRNGTLTISSRYHYIISLR